jgi:hypothetical protein
MLAQRPPCGDPRAGDEQGEGEQADQPQLDGRLERQRVRVECRLLDGMLLQPYDGVATEAGAGQRPVGKRRDPTCQ